MKRFLAVVLILAQLASGAWAENYGTTPTLDIPKLGEGNWGTKISNAFKGLSDFLSVSLNSDGTPKAGVSATQWQAVTTSVTYVSASSFSVSSSFASLFEVGRKVWLSQTADIIGTVISASTGGGVTTVTVGSIVLYSDNSTASTVTSPITNVSVSMVSPRSAVNDARADDRNYIINGGAQVAQRGATAVVNGSILYGGCDRIWAYPAGFTTATGTIQQYSGASTKTGFAQGTVLTTTGSGALYFGTRLEAKDVFPLNGKTVTFSFLAYHNKGSSLSVYPSVYKANSVDNFSALTGIQVGTPATVPSGTPTVVTQTVTLTASDASNGLLLQMQFDAVGAVTAKDFWVGNLQLEEGSVATSFKIRPYQQELALCQRYLPAFNGPNEFAFGNANTTSGGYVFYTFLVPPRVPPTGVLTSAVSGFTVGEFGIVSSTCTSLTFYHASERTASLLSAGTGTPYTIGRPLTVWGNVGTAQVLFTGSEL